ncbi:MAG: CPBP family intramembrane metalloprotease [Lachnospira sp.]|nr:CPBP family intramembrane metalloprotease [Lachnospira sp.]
MEIKKVNIFFPIFIFGYIFLNVAIALIESVLVSMGVIGKVTSAVLFIQNELIIVIMLLGFCLITKTGIKDLRFKMLGIKEIILSIIIGYLIIPMSLFLTNITSLFVENAAQQTVSEVSTYPLIIQIILIAVMPAIVEEFTFRGLYYGTYRKTKRYFQAMLLSAILFGFFHMNFDQFVYATFMGVVFAKLTEATGSILSSMCAHFAFNTFSVTVSYFASANASALQEASQQTSTDSSAGVTLLGLAILLVLGMLFLGIVLLIIEYLEKSRLKREAIQKEASPDVQYASKQYANVSPLDTKAQYGEVSAMDATASTATLENVSQDEKKERLITLPLVLGMIVCFAYMVFVAVAV